MLLLVPDYATAARTLSEGDLGAGPPLGTSAPLGASPPLGAGAPLGADPPGDDGPGGTAGDGGLLIDPLRLDVRWNGIPLGLTRLERAVLAHLAEAPLRAWSHEHLYHAAWGDAWLGDTSALHATVKRLRRKLRDAGVSIFLESIRGVGFRLDTRGAAVVVARAPN